MALEGDFGARYRFLKFGSLWSEPVRRAFLDRLASVLSHRCGDQEKSESLTSDGQAVLDAVHARSYADITGPSPQLRECFLGDIVTAASKSYRDAETRNPASELEHALSQLRTGDEKALKRLLKESAKLGVDPSRIRYYLDALEEQPNPTKRAVDPAALFSRAREDLAKLLEDYCAEFTSRFIAENFDAYLSELDGKYAALKLLHSRLGTLGRFFGRFWDLSSGTWEVSAWNSLAEYADRLERSPGLLDLIDSLGRLSGAERELRLEAIAAGAAKPAWRPGGIGKSEIAGIRFSDDIPSMLPSEAALLAFPETELLFLKRLAEKSLLTLEYLGEDRFEKPEPRTIQVKRPVNKRGPFILCVDTSGSMHGTPETIAKTIALAVTRKALEEDRPCILISFSTQIRTLELTAAAKGLEALLGFLAMSFHGGTDAGPALGYAVDKLVEETWKRADVLMVSDLVFPRPGQELCDKMLTARDAGVAYNIFRTFSGH